MIEKERREIHVATRMTESEYAEFIVKNMKRDGSQKINKSDFIRNALMGSVIRINDSEVEQYKCFILGKISHNLNQITKRLNQDNVANLVSETTYKSVLDELVALNEELSDLTLTLN